MGLGLKIPPSATLSLKHRRASIVLLFLNHRIYRFYVQKNLWCYAVWPAIKSPLYMFFFILVIKSSLSGTQGWFPLATWCTEFNLIHWYTRTDTCRYRIQEKKSFDSIDNSSMNRNQIPLGPWNLPPKTHRNWHNTRGCFTQTLDDLKHQYHSKGEESIYVRT